MGSTTAPVTGSGSWPAWIASVSKPWVISPTLVPDSLGIVPECLFCSIASGAAPGFLVASTDTAAAFLDIRPVFKGHVLVVPRTHVVTLIDLPESDISEYFGFVQKIAAAVESGLDAGGTF